jgi:hypothetical protein
MKAADIHIKMNVALIKVRRTGFPYFRVRIYSFQFKPYLLTNTIALNSVLYKKFALNGKAMLVGVSFYTA